MNEILGFASSAWSALCSSFLMALHAIDAHTVPIIASLQAFFTGGCAYLIAFKYQRGESSHQWVPSFWAFALASVMAQQWLSIVGRVLMYGEWPAVSIYNTFTFAILFVLLRRSKGNVARMFDFSEASK